jgi:protein gp37
MMTRQGRQPWGEIYRTKTLKDPLKWQKKAEKARQVERVFSCSMSDFFHVKADEWREEAWDVIRQTPNLVYFLLTKRPSRILQHLPDDWGDGWPNVWLGTTVVCKRDLPNMDILREVPVHPKAVRGLSIEPLLEDIADELDLNGFHWIAVGGESGAGEEYPWNPNGDWKAELQQTPGRRTMKLEWAERIRDKTKAAGLPFHFKQVTSPRSGAGINALGRDWHEYPPPPLPYPWKPQPIIEAKHLYTVEQLKNLDEGGRPKVQFAAPERPSA